MRVRSWGGVRVSCKPMTVVLGMRNALSAPGVKVHSSIAPTLNPPSVIHVVDGFTVRGTTSGNFDFLYFIRLNWNIRMHCYYADILLSHNWTCRIHNSLTQWRWLYSHMGYLLNFVWLIQPRFQYRERLDRIVNDKLNWVWSVLNAQSEPRTTDPPRKIEVALY